MKIRNLARLFTFLTVCSVMGVIYADYADAKRGYSSRSYSSGGSRSFSFGSSSSKSYKSRRSSSRGSYSKSSSRNKGYSNPSRSSAKKYSRSRHSQSASRPANKGYSSGKSPTRGKSYSSGRSDKVGTGGKSYSSTGGGKKVTGTKGAYSSRGSTKGASKPKALQKSGKAQRVAQKYKSKKAKQSYSAYKQKEAAKYQRKNPVNLSRTQARSSAFYRNASRNSRNRQSDRGYFERRDSLYSGYNPPTYVMMGSPAYGSLDAMFLGMALQNAMTPSYAGMFYHNQNSAEMRAWRSEMNELATDNAELRGQLAALDRQVEKMEGTPKQPGYIPEGVDPDLVLSPDAAAQVLPEFRMCTALPTGNYQVFGELLRNLSNDFEVTLVNTSGSLENLAKVDKKECDGALSQADAYWLYAEKNQATKLAFERVPNIYKEYGLFYCHRDGPVDDVDDLEEVAGKTLYVGPDGSGGEVMWANIVKEDDEFGVTKVQKMGGNAALASIKSNKNACGLFVSAGKSQFMKNLAKNSKWLKLVPATDNDFDEAEDPEGQKLYEFTDIPGGTFDGLQDSWFGGITTIAVKTDFIVAKSWIKRNGSARYDALIGTVLDAQEQFLQQIGQGED